jgi:hypothetical protein
MTLCLSMFRPILFCLFPLCFLSNNSFSQARDTIVFYNGQILIGEVQNANLGSITIDDIDLKMQNIKLFRIKKLVIEERFKIETVDKIFYFGSLKTSVRDGYVDIHEINGTIISLQITNIHELISMEGNFFKRLNGNVSTGLSFAKSSGIGQINFNANVQYATKLLDYQLSINSIGSIDSGHFSRDNENLQFFATYDLTSTWFLAASGQYQRNLELSIARRYLVLAGAGNKLIIQKNLRLLAITGVTFSQEKSIEGASSGLLYEIPIILQFNFYQFRHPDIQISTTQSVYFSLSEAGRVRYDGNTNISWQLIRYFYLNLSPYTNFDSKPPAGNASTFDFGVVFGISYKF